MRIITNGKTDKTVKLVLIDGWPGCNLSFLKLIEYLTTTYLNVSWDIIVPSIPGYGYSTPLNKPLDTIDTAHYFDALMRFIHNETQLEYFVHGEDWGSLVTNHLAQMYPGRVKAIHMSMPVAGQGFSVILNFLLANYAPSLFLTPEEQHIDYSLSKLVSVLVNELGYMHLQATKPDSIIIFILFFIQPS
jgi:juvenile hormone epoxide hydrolase